MNSELPIQWIVWGIVFFITMRCLITLSTMLRDRLQALLVAHVKNQQVKSKKRQRINELRGKIREKKANAEIVNANEKRAA